MTLCYASLVSLSQVWAYPTPRSSRPAHHPRDSATSSAAAHTSPVSSAILSHRGCCRTCSEMDRPLPCPCFHPHKSTCSNWSPLSNAASVETTLERPERKPMNGSDLLEIPSSWSVERSQGEVFRPCFRSQTAIYHQSYQHLSSVSSRDNTYTYIYLGIYIEIYRYHL
jgi:hypothetical protein